MAGQKTTIPRKGQDMEAGELNYRAPFEKKTAAYTVTPAESGKTFEADAAATVVFTLPATQAGLLYTFVVKQLPGSGAGTSISPNTNDKIMGNGFTAADDKDAINTAATDRVGDMITLLGDGVDGWYVVGINGTWAREA